VFFGLLGQLQVKETKASAKVENKEMKFGMKVQNEESEI